MSDLEDKEIWASYAEGVQKLGDKETPAEKTRQDPDIVRIKKEIKEKIEAKREEVILPAPPPPKPTVRQAQPLDTRIERNMSMGDVMIEARIDLHGRTEVGAHEDFTSFVQQQSGRGKRMLLVITGRSGILRTNLPRWAGVTPLSQYIMAVRSAAQHHGGEGAYYVLLHKQSR